MMFLRFALLGAAVLPAALAAAEPADAEARAVALAAELTRTQTALQESRDALAKQSVEIAAVRADAAATRIQLNKAQAETARLQAAGGPPPENPAALERERTAHIATKAILAQREAQVQDMAAERTKLESELRVLRTSADLAKSSASAESKTILNQSADLAARNTALARELNSAKSEITTVRHELREQGAKAAQAAEVWQNQLAAAQQSLEATRADLRRTQTSLEAVTAANAPAVPKPAPADVAALQIQERQLAALEQELAATRTQLAQANAAKTGTSAETEAQLKALRESNAALQGELTAAAAAARMQDRPTITEGELARLRERDAAARELEQRVTQLEAEKNAAMANRDTPADAQAAAENKLNIVLRSYSLLARERDALRAQVQALSGGVAGAGPAPVQPEPIPPARTRPNPAPVPVSFGGPGDPVPVLTVTRVAQPVQARPTPPGGVALGQPAFSHRIAPGETLASIARRYYGNPQRWPEIVAANRDVLPDQRSFTAGKLIRIP